MNKQNQSIFMKLTQKYFYWLALELIGATFLASIIVKGNNLIAEAVDTMLAGTKGEVINKPFIIGLITCMGFSFIASLLKDIGALQFSVNIQQDFRKKASNKLLKLEFKYFDTHGSGSILTKMIEDLNIAGEFFSDTLPTIIGIIVEAAILMFSIMNMDSMLIVAIAVCYPIVMMISHYASKRIAALAEKRWDKVDRMIDIAYDFMGGITIGRSFNLLPTMDHKIKEANKEILEFEFKRSRLSSISWVLNHLVNFMPHVVLGTVALFRVIGGSLTVGEMTYFILVLGRIIHPLGELPSLFNDAKSHMVSIKRLEAIIGQPEEASGEWCDLGQEKKDIPVIEFEDVSFGYETDSPVLKHLGFSIKKGQQVAFVGGSGEGKSTIFKLLCGFYKKSEGNYKLYGKAFEEWNIDAARKLFSLVSQNVFLFPETIAQNIGYGKKEATMEEIVQAAKDANIHEFIMTLSNGYETVVGERGERLSGGQKQRLSIARAFLKDAPILLLDEPTSAIDVETEELIKEAISRISKGRTVLTIAHRLSTIEDVDCIMVLSKGEIVEQGQNDALLEKQGVYAKLYEKQSEIQEKEAI